MTFFVCSRMSLSLRVCSYFASRPDKLEKSLGDGDFKVIVMTLNKNYDTYVAVDTSIKRPLYFQNVY